MAAMMEMILAVRDAGGRIAVFGDYDVDGISGSAVLLEMLRHIGAETVHRLPDRVTEGYGLQTAVVDGFAEEGVDLIITVDGGSNDLDALSHSQQLGIEVIVTDHHPIKQLPEGVPFRAVSERARYCSVEFEGPKWSCTQQRVLAPTLTALLQGIHGK